MTGTQRTSSLDVLALATVIACLTGLLHSVVLWWRFAVGREFVWQSRDHLWMAPISYLCFLLVLAVPGYAVARLVQRRRPDFDARRWLSALLILSGALAVLLLWPRLHLLAQLLVAMGVAVRGSGPLARVRERTMFRAAIVLASVVLLSGIGSRVWRGGVERRALAQLVAASESAPNVLLIILDTVRAASVSLHGYGQPTTPALQALGAEGTVFDRAISASPWTLPSHGSIFTGRDADVLNTSWRVPLDTVSPTIAELFRSRGYATAGFVANTYYTGYDSGLNRGFIRYEDYRTTFKQIVRSSTFAQVQLVAELGGSRSWRQAWLALKKFNLTSPVMPASHRKNGAMVTDDFLAWQAKSGGRPFFAFVNYFDAHEAYAPPAEYDSLFAVPTRKQRRYEGAIRYLDDQLRRMFDTLRVRGVLDQTIVVVTSDHGEHFGEHGRWGHGNTMFMELLHVPLVVRYPARVPPGVRVDQPVALRDLGATLVDLSGMTGASFPGTSLSRAWSGSVVTPEQESIASSLSSYEDAWLPLARQRTMQSIVVGDWHWIKAIDGAEFLFDWRRDPGERRNVWGDGEMRARFEAMRQATQKMATPKATDEKRLLRLRPHASAPHRMRADRARLDPSSHRSGPSLNLALSKRPTASGHDTRALNLGLTFKVR